MVPQASAAKISVAGLAGACPSSRDAFSAEGRRSLLDDLERCRLTNGGALTLVLIDLRRFHAVNASLGQSAGDELLGRIDRRLRRHFPTALLSRLSGARFALALRGIERESEVVRLADELLGILETPFPLADRRLRLAARLGIACSAEGDTSELLRNAVTALCHARETERTAVVFQPHHHRRTVDLFELENELYEALDQQQLRLRYQPIVTLPDRRPGGLEVLLRWRHPRRGLLLPAAFLAPLAGSPLSARLDRWVLTGSIRQLAGWRGEGLCLPPQTLSVNVGGQLLAAGDLPELLAEELAATQIEPSAVKLEITEEKLPEQRESIYSTLSRLGAMGIGLHLDDFGTGYAYLTRLHRVRSEALKIDRSFIASMLHNPIHREIVRGLIELAQRLGLQSIAEGVESEAQVELLEGFGCSHAQGFYFSPPIAGEAVPLWLGQGR